MRNWDILAMLHCALGEFDSSANELERSIEFWPDSFYVPSAKRMLYTLHVENGRFDDAIRIAEDLKAMLRKRFAREARQAKVADQIEAFGRIEEADRGKPHRFIPVPLVAQNQSQCVPTTVAMATYPEGRRLDPDILYEEMHGRDGTPLWRMRQWCLNNGLQVIPVRFDRKPWLARSIATSR